MVKLTQYMDDRNTDPAIQQAISECLTSWRQNQQILLRDFAPSIRDTIQRQHAIGWKNILEGLPDKGWRQAQHTFYSER
jgi:hypothetical protein